MDDKVFDDKTLGDIFSEIHTNSANKRARIEALIVKYSSFIVGLDEAVVFAPIIKDLLEVAVSFRGRRLAY